MIQQPDPMTQQTQSTFRFGVQSPFEVDLPPEVTVAEVEASHSAPLEDPAAAVFAALTSPIDFPPLSEATVPGDRAAIVLDEGLPRRAELAAGAVEALLAAGFEPKDITLVDAADTGDARDAIPRSCLSEKLAQEVGYVIHDPDDSTELFYLGASKQNRPVYVNRRIGDSDFVLPIVCRRPATAMTTDAVFSGVFPRFSNGETIQRFHTPGAMRSDAQRRQRAREIDEDGAMLGVFMSVEVVPGLAGAITHILAGATQVVASRASQLTERQWSWDTKRRFDLVVAALDGDPLQQTWTNAAHALEAALRVVADGGAILLCTELSAAPGAAMRLAADAEKPESALRAIRRDHSPDAWPAHVLAQALGGGPVYLLSRLEDGTVESIGAAPVRDAEEITRLLRRFGDCLLLQNAQLIQPQVTGE